jgi:hypothetical protein
MNDKLWLANSGPTIPARNAKGEIDEALTEGWGLSFSLSHAPSYIGRAASTGSWEGLANLFWFIDRENGLGGIIAAQILPYGGNFIPVSPFPQRFHSLFLLPLYFSSMANQT